MTEASNGFDLLDRIEAAIAKLYCSEMGSLIVDDIEDAATERRGGPPAQRPGLT